EKRTRTTFLRLVGLSLLRRAFSAAIESSAIASMRSRNSMRCSRSPAMGVSSRRQISGPRRVARGHGRGVRSSRLRQEGLQGFGKELRAADLSPLGGGVGLAEQAALHAHGDDFGTLALERAPDPALRCGLGGVAVHPLLRRRQWLPGGDGHLPAELPPRLTK